MENQCMEANKWPKVFPPLTDEQIVISNDFMQHWHEVLSNGSVFKPIENFNHGFPTKHLPHDFISTLEIGAGLGEHLEYESLTPLQKSHYTAVEIRENMANAIKSKYPDINTLVADCQMQLPFIDHHFDRILAIHVLEHLPNLPATIREMYRLCNKEHGIVSIVIPCEGGILNSLARKLSGQRIFEKRYKQSYSWFINREHINTPEEILAEIEPYFDIVKRRFFPFHMPSVHLNLVIGLTLKPKWPIKTE